MQPDALALLASLTVPGSPLWTVAVALYVAAYDAGSIAWLETL
jgi:hypothetical protein